MQRIYFQATGTSPEDLSELTRSELTRSERERGLGRFHAAIFNFVFLKLACCLT